MNHHVEMYSPALLCFCMLLACFSFISNYSAVLGSEGEHRDSQPVSLTGTTRAAGNEGTQVQYSTLNRFTINQS